MNTLVAALILISQVIVGDQVVAVTLSFNIETCNAKDEEHDGFRTHEWCVSEADIPSDEQLFAKQVEI